MYGQGNYAPQFRQGPPPHPPPFQQGPPPFQQGLPPPPPPLNHDGHSAAPPHVVQPTHHHPMYQHAPPPPPPPSSLQQGGPPRPPQPFMQPSISGYMNSSMPMSNTNLPQNAQFPAPMPHSGAILSGPGNSEALRAPLPPRVFPPPPSHGQMMYVTPHQPPHSIGQGIQHGHLLPPPQSSFVSVTPAPFVSIPQPPPEHAHPPSMPPPPPPPPPSSPPPLPPPPPPPSASSPDFSTRSSPAPSFRPINTSSMSQQLQNNSGTDRISDISEGVIDSVDKGVGPVCTSDNIPESGDHQIDDGGTSCDKPMVKDRVSSKTQPPPKPAAKEVVRQIEVLCQYIVRNGSDFEVTARTKEHGNPKFAFLFGGEPGSEAAIAHEYFQWMKRKSLVELKSHNGSVQSGSPLRPSKVESSVSPNRYGNAEACESRADSDMDMEDDTHQINKDQGDGASVKVTNDSVSINNGVLIEEQQLENQCQKDYTMAGSQSKVESSSDIPVTAREEREYDHIPLGSSAGASECTSDFRTEKSTLPLEDSTPPKASPAPAARINYKEVSDPVSKIGSPFRLIQDYASDDSGEADDGPSFDDVSPERDFPSATVGNTSLLEEEGTNVKLNTGSLSTPISEKGVESLTESSFSSLTNVETNTGNLSTPISEKGVESLAESSSLSPTNTPSRIATVSKQTPKVVEATAVGSSLSDAIAKTNDLDNDNHVCLTSSDLGHGDSLRGDSDLDSQSGKIQKGGEKQDSAVLKVDEFGRMVREGGSDSDSDVEHYGGRRYRRGRSRSPLDRRRRRSRSPRRRTDKRNRSRSWSPRKRRSMSKSRSPPAFRHTGEFSGEKMRRDRDHIPECYDFTKGRCHRGASCRFLHRKSGSGDAARHSRGRQQHHGEDPQDLSNSAAHRDSRLSVDKHEVNIVHAKNEHDISEEDATTAKLPCSDMAVSSIDVTKDKGIDEKKDACFSVHDAQLVTSVEVGQSVSAVIAEVGQEAIVQGLENRHVQQELETLTVTQDNEISKVQEEINQPLSTAEPTNEAETREMSGRTPSTDPSLTEDAVHQPIEANCKASNLSVPLSEKPLSDQGINASIASPPESFTHQHSQLPLPPPPPLVMAQVSLPLREYNAPPVSTNVYPQPTSGERYPPYQAPLNDQYSQSVVPSNVSWTSLPTSLPPPPPVSHSQAFHPTQFQQNLAPLMRPYQHGDLSHSQPLEFRPPTFPPTGELHRPPLRTEGMPFEYPKALRDERFPHSSILDGNHFHPGPRQVSSLHPPHQLREEHHFPQQVHDSRNFQPFPNQRFTGLMAPDNMRTQPLPFSNDSQLQSFPDGNSQHNSISKGNFGTTIANHSFTQQQHQPTFGMQWSGAVTFPSHLGSAENAGPSVRRYPMNFEDESRTSHLSVGGGSRISAHYNPFASTFSNIPDSSKYNSIFKQESLPIPVSRYDSLGLNQALPPDSNRSGGQILPKSGDPYDPLFDSIEPSKASRKYEHVEGGNLTGDVISKSVAARSIVDSPAITKSNNVHGTINKEVKKQTEGAAAAITSPENDEFGETAIDAEVGALESESPDNPIDIADKAMGDVEIDQVQSKGKSKKTKDSRSMKLFKVALADFVKDVLKPSWRQGNMSKEAFKTIVKKTVDKVAGAMKNNQVPKGQAKINQYVESSQRKLTKLVMGYVDKYVKS